MYLAKNRGRNRYKVLGSQSMGYNWQWYRVGEYLYTQGILDQRIITVGMGEHFPVADNGTSDGRQMNRRVEITREQNVQRERDPSTPTPSTRVCCPR